MPASLDPRKAHLSRQHGDLTVIFTWVNDERAMILLPTYRKGAPWFVVMESAAHTWDDTNQRTVFQVIGKATKACEVLGIEATPTNIRRLAGIVIDGLPDLIRMPSSPPKEYHRASFGHLELYEDKQLIKGEDIRLEKEGVTYG